MKILKQISAKQACHVWLVESYGIGRRLSKVVSLNTGNKYNELNFGKEVLVNDVSDNF